MIYLRLFSQDRMNWVMAGFVFLWMVFLLIFKKKSSGFQDDKGMPAAGEGRQPEGKVSVWSLLCEVPLGVCLLHFLFFHFKGNAMQNVLVYGGFYFVAVLTALFPLLFRKSPKEPAKGRRIVQGIGKAFLILVGALGCLFPVIYVMAAHCGLRNYSHDCYEEAFRKAVENIKEYDSVIAWKETDVDAIKEEILPMVKEAEEKQDPALYYAALCHFTYYFYDGHTYVASSHDAIRKKAEEILAGNDYGLSMLRLTDGEVIATLVEEGSGASQSGIKNGVQILKWDGKDIQTAISEVECIYTKEYGRWPVKENEEVFQPVFLAGKGGEQVEVVWKAEDGTEKTSVLKKNGSYRGRLERACEILLAKDKLTEKKNYDTKMLSEDCGYIRITDEEYSVLYDNLAFLTGSNPQFSEMFAKKLASLKEQGMKKLIIDLRNNTGGCDSIPLEIISFFTKEKLFIYNKANLHDGRNEIVRREYAKADGSYADIPVTVLTNCRCVSSGDFIIAGLRKCPNVKVTGITASAQASQPVGGACVMTDGICEIRYPQNWMLEENGDRFVDPGKERENRLLLDEKIPLTKESVKDMFENGVDYELEYVVKNFG